MRETPRDSESPEQHRLVFLGGLHRSGTTLLARMIAAHPAVSAFTDTGVPEDEGEHLQSVYPDSWEFGGTGRFGFHPEMHLTEDACLPGMRDRLWTEYSRWWDLSRTVLVEKSPPNILKMRYLQALFPQARFIVVMRHPVAVTCATLKWRSRFERPIAPHRLIRHWLHCHRLAASDIGCLRRVLVVSYEHLVGEPEAELERVRSFLDLDGSLPSQPAQRGHNDRYFRAWSDLKQNTVRNWYLDWLESGHETALRRFGYSFAQAEPLVGATAFQAQMTDALPFAVA